MVVLPGQEFALVSKGQHQGEAEHAGAVHGELILEWKRASRDPEPCFSLLYRL